MKFRALRRRALPRVEDLEARQLLTGAIADVASVASSAAVSAIVSSTSGASVWYAQGNSSVSMLSANGSKVVVALPSGNTSAVTNLTIDSTGDAWYSRGNMIGKVVTSGTSGTATEYALPAGDKAGAETLGPDGNIWVAITKTSGMAIAKVDASGNITEVPLSGVSQIKNLTTGPDGDLWFVDGQSIAKTSLTGQVTHYTVPARADGSVADLSNAQLVAGAGNRLWFLGLGGISSITTDGTFKTYATPSTQITSLTFATDGNLWFSFQPSSVPTSSLSSTPGAIVGRMTQDGQITLVNDRANGNNAPIVAITPTKDGNLWLDEGGSAIALLSQSTLPAASNPIIRPTTVGYVSTDASGAFNGALVSFAPNTTDTSSQVYKASIDWGDGTGSVGTVAKNTAGDYSVLGLHTYAFPANTLKGVIVTIQDANGNTAQIFNTVKIKPITITAIMPTTTSTTTATSTSTTTTTIGQPVEAGTVKQAIMAVLKAGGTNAQALAAAEQTALTIKANRLAGVTTAGGTSTTATTSTGTTSATGTRTTLTGTTTTATTTSTPMTRRGALIAARAAMRAHPRGPARLHHR